MTDWTPDQACRIAAPQEATDADLPTVDSAYRQKYGHYPDIVDHLITPEPRGATLQVRPA